MARIFLSHWSGNNTEAIALRDWLVEHGWDDLFLDLDPERGLKAGERWQEALKQAAERCELVIFLVSPGWAASKWCLAEFLLAKSLNKRVIGVIVDATPFDDLPVEMTSEWQLVDLTEGKRDHEITVTLPSGEETQTVSFATGGLDRLRIGLMQAGLDARYFAWPPEDDPDRAPYRGLEPLEGEDAGIFFGRDAPTVVGLDLLRGLREAAPPRLVVILGASGAGKSSFLRAGLLPRLARESQHFVPLPVIRPERAVISGEVGLIASLETALKDAGVARTRGDIRKALEGGPERAGALLEDLVNASTFEHAADDAPSAPTLVLAVDQAEELFHAEGAEEAGAFLDLLRALAANDSPALIVLFTIRSDSYERLQTAKSLEGLRQHTLSLPPMPKGAYAEVIKGPAQRLDGTKRSLAIEEALVDALLADIEDGGAKDALPLLAFTLERLYREEGGDGDLKLSEYEELGRVRGSIEAAVEHALQAADRDPKIPHDRDARLRLLRRGLIPWLAGIDPDTGSPRRRVARRAEIPEESAPLIDLLVDQRLLATDVSKDTGEVTIEPVHEALLRQWGLLNGWLEEDLGALTTLEGVKRAALDWVANDRQPDWLNHAGTRLEEAELFATREDLAGDLRADARQYLKQCREQEDARKLERLKRLEAEREEQERRVKDAETLAVANKRAAQRTGIGLLAALALLVAAGWQWWEADKAKKLAVANEEQAIANEAMARSEKTAKEQQLRQARVNESKYLSARARQAALAGDVELAKNLVSLALPVDPKNPERPLLPESLAALPEIFSRDALIASFPGRTAMTGHAANILSAVLSSDSKLMVTASNDVTAIVWDASTGARLLMLWGHDDSVLFAEFSPGDKLVLTGSRDRTARLWDSATGEELHVLRGHQDYVTTAVFSADGKRVLTGSKDDTARVWDAATGEQLHVLQGHKGDVVSVAFSPDGKLILTASLDNSARLWDAATGRELKDFRHGRYATMHTAAFSADGTRVLTGAGDNTARLWDADTGEELRVFQHNEYSDVTDVAFSADGTRVLTGSDDNTARLWDAATGEQLHMLQGHEDDVTSVAFSPDEKLILTASYDDTARLWDAATGEELKLFRGHEDDVHTAAFSADGTRILTASFDIAHLSRADAREPLQVLSDDDGFVTAPVFSADGTRVLVGSEGGAARVWDASSGAQLQLLQGHEADVAFAAFSPDEKLILTASYDDTARLWDAATGEALRVFQGHEDDLNSAAFSSDGKRILTASDDGTARLWDAATGEQLQVLLGHGDSIAAAEFSPDDKLILTLAYWGEPARIWDASTGEQLHVLEHGLDDGDLTSAQFSPDGRLVLTSAEDTTVRLWNVTTGRLLRVIRGHTSAVDSAAFSPDGRLILTTSTEDVRVWETATGKLLEVFRGSGPAAFSPDGKLIAARSGNKSDSSVLIWDAATGAPLLGIGSGQDIESVRFSPDGARVLTVSDEKAVRIWQAPGPLHDMISYLRASISRPLTEAQRSDLGLVDGKPGRQDVVLNECDRLAASPFDPTRHGPGVPFALVDHARAIVVCKDAVAQGSEDPRMHYQLGRAQHVAYFNRRDAEAKEALKKESTEYYRIAAAAGHVAALYQLTLIDDMPREEKLAQLRRAYDGGFPLAARALALVYLDGKGPSADISEGLRWLETAADEGNPHAHGSLGASYWDGAEALGIEKNWEQALFHFAIAAKLMEGQWVDGRGFEYDLNRANLARRLPMGVVAAAYDRAQAWQPKGKATAPVAGPKESPPVVAARESDSERDLYLSHIRVGDALKAQGNLDESLKSYRDSLDIAERLAKARPDRTDLQRDLAFSRAKVGEVLKARGDLAEALKFYQESLTTAERLAKAAPENESRQRDLDATKTSVAEILKEQEALSHASLGDALLDQGRLDEALASHQAALDIRQQLAEAEPDQTYRRVDLAWAHQRVGGVLKAQDKIEEALGLYRAGLAINEKLAEEAPDVTDRQTDLASAHRRIGDVLKQEGRLEEALGAYRADLAVLEKLAEAAPDTAERQTDLASAYRRIGDVLKEDGKLDVAAGSYRSELAVHERLTAANPKNTQHLNDLAGSYSNLGNLLRDHGKLDDALDAYRERLAVNTRLTEAYPDNSSYQSYLAGSYYDVGSTLQAQGKLDDAFDAYRETLAIYKRLTEAYPDHADYQSYLAGSYIGIGYLRYAERELDGALEAFRESLAINKRLTESHPDSTEYRAYLAESYHSVGQMLAAQGKFAGAFEAFRDGLAITKKLVANDDSDAGLQSALDAMIESIGALSYKSVQGGDFVVALDAADRAIALAPDQVWLHGNRAHALMFLGRTDEARALYLKYRGKKNVAGGKPWETVALNDFTEIRMAKLEHPLMDEIEQEFMGQLAATTTNAPHGAPESIADTVPNGLTGIWEGFYVCGQGRRALTLTLESLEGGRFWGKFAFSPAPDGPTIPSGVFYVSGSYGVLDGDTSVHIDPGPWIEQPHGYSALQIEGNHNLPKTPLSGADENSATIKGRVLDAGCGDFEARRVSENAPSLGAMPGGIVLSLN